MMYTNKTVSATTLHEELLSRFGRRVLDGLKYQWHSEQNIVEKLGLRQSGPGKRRDFKGGQQTESHREDV